MMFTHDTEVALQTMAALVNTASEEPDALGDLGDLDAFVDDWDYRGHRRRDADELRSVRRLRGVLAQAWTAPTDDVAGMVNQLLGEHDARPQLVRHDDWDWHLHAHRAETSLPARMAVEAAMALVDVIRGDELDRLRTCAADDCGRRLVDLSRNRSRRYCDGNCGNRLAVAAYRQRQRDTVETGS